MPDSNWQRVRRVTALHGLTDTDLDWLIRLIHQHEQQTGQSMTALELRLAILDRRE